MGFDLNAPFGEDLSIGPAPDIGVVGQMEEDFNFLQQRDEFIQRIIRRLLTGKGEWIPFPNYGAGLRQKVNSVLTAANLWDIRQTCISQILQEPDVASTPPLTVDIAQIPNGIVVTIKVFTASIGLVSFAFNPAEV